MRSRSAFAIVLLAALPALAAAPPAQDTASRLACLTPDQLNLLMQRMVRQVKRELPAETKVIQDKYDAALKTAETARAAYVACVQREMKGEAAPRAKCQKEEGEYRALRAKLHEVVTPQEMQAFITKARPLVERTSEELFSNLPDCAGVK